MRTAGSPVVYHMAHQVGDEGMALDESALFSQSLNSILDGFVPFEIARQRAAERGFARCNEGRMEERTRMLLCLSLNPMTLLGRIMPDLHALKQTFDLFSATAPGMRNIVEVHGDQLALDWSFHGSLTARERLLTNDALVCLFDVTRRYILDQLPLPPQLPEAELGFPLMLALGRALNRTHTAEYALIEVLGEQPGIQAEAAAKAVGCSGRTLQRRLHASGLSLPRLRLAGQLLRGVGQMRYAGALTDIAVDAGFSDYSHFARTLGRSCGFRPTGFQQVLTALGRNGCPPRPACHRGPPKPVAHTQAHALAQTLVLAH